MKSVTRRHQMLFAAAGLLLGAGVIAHAAESSPADEIVKYRQAVMKSQGAHLAAAAAIIQGKVPFKDQLAAHVNSLEATTLDIDKIFPKESDVGDTKALKEVWSNNDEFLKRAKDAQEKSAALAKTVAAGDTANYGPSLKGLLDACKACHKDFRKKEEK
jgi:cytochrome c556